LTANIKNIQLLMWLFYQSQYWHAVEYNFLLCSDKCIFEEKQGFKKSCFFAFISLTDKKFLERKIIHISCCKL